MKNLPLSISGYEALQSQLLENNLCTTVVSMARYDSECYVRASALRCLRSMIRVNALWTTCLKPMELMDQISALLANESEGIVRREAVDTLITIYTLQRSKLDRILTTMIHCAAVDLHWEVRLNALEFWRLSLEQSLMRQGMTDGTFPPQIFSTEQKKIITLTEREIEARIGKALAEFAGRGGFGVLLVNLEDTTDFEVIKAAIAIIDGLQAKLDKYNFEPVLAPEAPVSPPREAAPENVEFGGKISEEILDTIVNENDINLLVGAHQNALNGLHIEQRYDESVGDKFKSVSVGHFFQALKGINLRNLQVMRHDWLLNTESFSSLLDDVIFSFQESEVNGMDCY